jgi:hypothetical protein
MERPCWAARTRSLLLVLSSNWRMVNVAIPRMLALLALTALSDLLSLDQGLRPSRRRDAAFLQVKTGCHVSDPLISACRDVVLLILTARSVGA